MKQLQHKKYLSIFLLIFFVLFVAMLSIPPTTAFAFSSVFDKRTCEEDMQEMTINNVRFDSKAYDTLHCTDLNYSLVNFVEYGYTYDSNEMDKFGLYMYFYKPQNLQGVNLESVSNKVQLKVDSKYLPDTYNKYLLKMISFTDSALYNGTFYKFKIIDAIDRNNHYIANKADRDCRRYQISGVEFQLLDNSIVDMKIAKEFMCEGFAKNCGSTLGESTLKMTSRGTEVLKLNVQSADFTTNANAKGEEYQTKIYSAYFGVPRETFAKYGELSSIKFEYYEYATKPIIVANSANYETFNKIIGKKLGNTYDPYTISFGSHLKIFSTGNPLIHQYIYNYGYNLQDFRSFESGDGKAGTVTNSANEKLDCIYWVFNSGANAPNNYTVSNKEILNYASNYKGSGDKVLGKYDKNLFEKRTMDGKFRYFDEKDLGDGGKPLVLSSDNKYNILNYQEANQKSDFQMFFEKTGYKKIQGTSIKDLVPIVHLDSASDIASQYNSLYLDNYYKDNFISYCNNQNLAENDVILFRFAVRDYYASPINYEFSNDYGGAEMRFGACFLNFDIIELKFVDKNSVETWLPCVSNPIDIFFNASPAVEFDFEKFKKIFKLIVFIIMCILGFIVFFPLVCIIVKYIIKLIVFIIKGIWSLFKKVFSSVKLKSKKAPNNKDKLVRKNE